jgi:O-antigen biosynthesis protein
MHPHVDIICLVHNKLPVTKGFVKDLFDNTSNFRLIFIDNASTDDTPKYLEQGKQEGKWEVVTSPTNLGVIGGRNLGATYVNSDFFINIDNDQYVQNHWLEMLFELIDKGYDLVGPEAWLLLPPKSGGAFTSGNITTADRSYFPIKRCTKVRDKFSYIGCGGTLLKTEIYKKIGLFDERFNPAYFEDPDFTWRVMKAGYKIGWQPKCSILHLAHQTIGTQQLFDKNEQFVKSWKKFREKWFPHYPDPISMEGVL